MNDLPKVGRIRFFGVAMDALSMEETVLEIERRMATGCFTQHVVVNVAKLVQMQDNHELADAIQRCDIVNIDGAGIVFGGRILGFSIPERVAGIDLFERLLAYGEQAGRSVFLLGATSEIIAETVSVVRRRFPGLKIAGYHHGYFWEDEKSIVREIHDSGAEMLFVGIGSPMKERFIDRWRDDFGVLFAMGVGGSFDVISGKVKRAPRWMQTAGLEWLYRTIQEPRRMWWRYLSTNTRFAWMILREMLGQVQKSLVRRS